MTERPEAEKKKCGRPAKGDRPMTNAERAARRRKKAKAELLALKSGVRLIAGKTAAVMSPIEVGLFQLAQQGTATLVPQIAKRLAEIRDIFEQADVVLTSGKNLNKGQFMKDTRDTCQWLTDALEQLSQCGAASKVQTVHQTKLARQAYADQAWGNIAALCCDISSSNAWERIKANDMPDFIKRGIAVFGNIPMINHP